MENQPKMGMNYTGIKMSPFDSRQQTSASDKHRPDIQGSIERYAKQRQMSVRESERIGSVPIPGSARGTVKTSFEKIKGKNPEVLIDKLGERLAFERTGVRLYDAMIAKAQALGEQEDVVAQLIRIRDDEADHMERVIEAMERMGADSTALTPCADVSGVSSMGLLQVITDPRTTMIQSLSALLTIELTDNAAWELLIELAHEAGHDEIIPPFEQALEQEKEHLRIVNQWMKRGLQVQMIAE